MTGRAPLSPVRWLTARSRRWDPLGVPVRLEGYNWKRKVRLRVLAGPGRDGVFFAHALDLAHDNGDAALNALLAALAFLPSKTRDIDPGAPRKGQAHATLAESDPLENALL